MPFEGEFAGYKPLQRIAQSERVLQLLRRARVFSQATAAAAPDPKPAPAASGPLPEFVVAIDGSYAEVDVKNGYPGANRLECKACGLILADIDELHAAEIEPHFEFNEMTELHEFQEPDFGPEYNNM